MPAHSVLGAGATAARPSIDAYTDLIQELRHYKNLNVRLGIIGVIRYETQIMHISNRLLWFTDWQNKCQTGTDAVLQQEKQRIEQTLSQLPDDNEQTRSLTIKAAELQKIFDLSRNKQQSVQETLTKAVSDLQDKLSNSLAGLLEQKELFPCILETASTRGGDLHPNFAFLKDSDRTEVKNLVAHQPQLVMGLLSATTITPAMLTLDTTILYTAISQAYLDLSANTPEAEFTQDDPVAYNQKWLTDFHQKMNAPNASPRTILDDEDTLCINETITLTNSLPIHCNNLIKQLYENLIHVQAIIDREGLSEIKLTHDWIESEFHNNRDIKPQVIFCNHLSLAVAQEKHINTFFVTKNAQNQWQVFYNTSPQLSLIPSEKLYDVLVILKTQRQTPEAVSLEKKNKISQLLSKKTIYSLLPSFTSHSNIDNTLDAQRKIISLFVSTCKDLNPQLRFNLHRLFHTTVLIQIFICQALDKPQFLPQATEKEWLQETIETQLIRGNISTELLMIINTTGSTQSKHSSAFFTLVLTQLHAVLNHSPLDWQKIKRSLIQVQVATALTANHIKLLDLLHVALLTQLGSYLLPNEKEGGEQNLLNQLVRHYGNTTTSPMVMHYLNYLKVLSQKNTLHTKAHTTFNIPGFRGMNHGALLDACEDVKAAFDAFAIESGDLASLWVLPAHVRLITNLVEQTNIYKPSNRRWIRTHSVLDYFLSLLKNIYPFTSLIKACNKLLDLQKQESIRASTSHSWGLFGLSAKQIVIHNENSQALQPLCEAVNNLIAAILKNYQHYAHVNIIADLNQFLCAITKTPELRTQVSEIKNAKLSDETKADILKHAGKLIDVLKTSPELQTNDACKQLKQCIDDLAKELEEFSLLQERFQEATHCCSTTVSMTAPMPS